MKAFSFVATMILCARPGPSDASQEIQFDAATAFMVPAPLPGFGVTYVYSPTQRFALDVGAEWRFVSNGPQFSIVPRFVLGGETDRFMAGAGIQAGWIDAQGGGQKFFRGSGATYSVRADLVGYEHRFASGVSLSVSAGVAVGLAGARFCVIECRPGEEDRDWRGAVLPQGRLSIGRWF